MIQDMISAYSINCDLKEIAKNEKKKIIAIYGIKRDLVILLY